MSKNNKPRINALPALLLLSATVGATLSGSVAAAERDLRSDSRAEMDRRKTELAKEEGTSLAQADTEEVAPKGDGATGMKGETTTSLSLRR